MAMSIDKVKVKPAENLAQIRPEFSADALRSLLALTVRSHAKRTPFALADRLAIAFPFAGLLPCRCLPRCEGWHGRALAYYASGYHYAMRL